MQVEITCIAHREGFSGLAGNHSLVLLLSISACLIRHTYHNVHRLDRMNIRHLYQGKSFTLTSCAATLQEVYPYSFSVADSNLSSCVLVSACTGSRCGSGSEFNSTELPDTFAFGSTQQISLQNFNRCEVKARFTPSTFITNITLYPIRAGIENLLNS